MADFVYTNGPAGDGFVGVRQTGGNFNCDFQDGAVTWPGTATTATIQLKGGGQLSIRMAYFFYNVNAANVLSFTQSGDTITVTRTDTTNNAPMFFRFDFN